MNFKIKRGAKCAVVGYGSWATALAKLLAENGVCASWWVGNTQVLESLRSTGHNCRYLNDLTMDTSRITLSDNLDLVVSQADVILLAAPSAYLEQTLASMTMSLQDKFVVSAIKGIVPHELTTVIEYVKNHHGLNPDQLGVITGPSHAEEVAVEKLSYLTVVSTDLENAHTLGEMFATPYIHLSYSTDLYGIEYAAVLKNIYAIAVGIAVGLGYGDNFLAVLISNSALEMTRLLRDGLPDKQRETCASAYLGDLLVTCYSEYSRNRRLGQLVGRGLSASEALDEMTQVAEGYFAAGCVRYIYERYSIPMPIAEMVHRVLHTDADAREAMQELTAKLI